MAGNIQRGRAEMGTSSPGYTHAPYFSSQKGASPANLQEKKQHSTGTLPAQQSLL